jgi:hypothetical protein
VSTGDPLRGRRRTTAAIKDSRSDKFTALPDLVKIEMCGCRENRGKSQSASATAVKVGPLVRG